MSKRGFPSCSPQPPQRHQSSPSPAAPPPVPQTRYHRNSPASGQYRVASGIRCKSASAGSDFMGRLCGGSGSFWLIIGLGRCDGAWPQLTGWFEQRAAQVLQEPQAIWGHGQAAPAAGGPVEHGPDQGEAAGLAGQPADDLDAAAGLAEGSLDEVGMPDALVVVRREPQVGGQALPVCEQD